MKWIHGLVVVFLIVIGGDVNGQIISPYQVSIRLYDNFIPNGNGENINLCNGAVIHEKIILTTADCMHARIRSANISRPHNPSMLWVAAGTFSSNPTNTRYVNAIYIHEKYNPDTLENDIALIQLNEPLPLRNNVAIQWIELDGKNTRHENCVVSFQNRTSSNYPYTSPQSTYIMDNWFCNKNLSNSTTRNNDICSHYIFQDSSMCKLQQYQYQVSSDRGTPLVCNNHLTGLLSQILPPQNVSNTAASCESTLKTWAFYTQVSNYTEWIHQTIARQQPPAAAPGLNPSPQQPVTSPPFYTPPQNPVQQPPANVPGQKPSKSGSKSQQSTLANMILGCCIVYSIVHFLC